MAKNLTEKEVIDFIVLNWKRFFEKDGLHFKKKEWQPIPTYKCDIMSYINMKHPSYTNRLYEAVVMLEVKHNDSAKRDLIYELKKALYIKNKCKECGGYAFVGVLMNEIINDETINNFIKENNIFIWKYNIQDNDLNNLKIKFIEN